MREFFRFFYTLASGLVRLALGLARLALVAVVAVVVMVVVVMVVTGGGLACSTGLVAFGGGLVGLVAVAAAVGVAVAAAAGAGSAGLPVDVVTVVIVVVGLASGFRGLVAAVDGTGLVAVAIAGVAADVGLTAVVAVAAAGGLAGSVGLAGLVGGALLGLERFAAMVSACCCCCSGPFSRGLLVTVGGWNIIRTRWRGEHSDQHCDIQYATYRSIQ